MASTPASAMCSCCAVVDTRPETKSCVQALDSLWPKLCAGRVVLQQKRTAVAAVDQQLQVNRDEADANTRWGKLRRACSVPLGRFYATPTDSVVFLPQYCPPICDEPIPSMWEQHANPACDPRRLWGRDGRADLKLVWESRRDPHQDADYAWETHFRAYHCVFGGSRTWYTCNQRLAVIPLVSVELHEEPVVDDDDDEPSSPAIRDTRLYFHADNQPPRSLPADLSRWCRMREPTSAQQVAEVVWVDAVALRPLTEEQAFAAVREAAREEEDDGVSASAQEAVLIV